MYIYKATASIIHVLLWKPKGKGSSNQIQWPGYSWFKYIMFVIIFSYIINTPSEIITKPFDTLYSIQCNIHVNCYGTIVNILIFSVINFCWYCPVNIFMGINFGNFKKLYWHDIWAYLLIVKIVKIITLHKLICLQYLHTCMC